MNSSELNGSSEYEMLIVLCDRMYSLRTMLQEKSDSMVKLQADYELLKVVDVAMIINTEAPKESFFSLIQQNNLLLMSLQYRYIC